MKVRTSEVTSILVGVTTGMLVACGVVGAPVPPESIGVTPTIERQKKLEALDEKQREAAAAAESSEAQPGATLQGQDADPPSLQPVGTR